MTPEEAKTKARDSAIAAGEEQVATFLKSQFQNLGMLYKELDVPDLTKATPEELKKIDDDFRRMARELIDEKKRAFTAKTKDGGTITISLDDLNEKDSKEQLGLKESLRVDNLQQAVPTRTQLEATANAVGDGVAENTGTIGFLGGATVMNTLSGFFQWLVGLFTGETSFSMDSLKKTIAGVTATRMEESVANNLAELRQKDAGMGAFLSDDAIASAARNVGDTVREQTGITTPGESKPGGLAATSYATVGDNERRKISLGIEKAIKNPDGKPPLAEFIAEKWAGATKANQDSRWVINPFKWFSVGVVTKEEAMPLGKKAADIIAKTVADKVTDPNYRTADGKKLATLNKDEMANALTNEIGTAILEKEKELGLSITLADKDEISGKTYIELVKDMIRPEIAPHHERLVAIAKTVDPDTKTAQAHAKNTSNPNLETSAVEVANADAPKAPPSVPREINERSRGQRIIS